MSIYGDLNPNKTIKVENSFQAPRKHIRNELYSKLY